MTWVRHVRNALSLAYLCKRHVRLSLAEEVVRLIFLSHSLLSLLFQVILSIPLPKDTYKTSEYFIANGSAARKSASATDASTPLEIVILK